MFGLNAFGRLGAVIRSAFEFSPLGLLPTVFYDYSDLSTMFQDRAGTTPVTEDGQPVGLILDKSQGLALGPDVITNSADRDFSSDTGFWTIGAGCSISGGVVNANVSVDTWVIRRDNLMPKGYIEITYTITVTSGSVTCVTPASANGPTRNSSGTYIERRYMSSLDLFGLRAYGPFVGTIDNVSIKAIAGNPASQATAAARPLKARTGASQWIDFDAVDDVLNITFPSSLGSNCTVARAVVGGAPVITTGQTIGTSYAMSIDNAGLVIVNRALTGQETTDLTAWLTAKGATS